MHWSRRGSVVVQRSAVQVHARRLLDGSRLFRCGNTAVLTYTAVFKLQSTVRFCPICVESPPEWYVVSLSGVARRRREQRARGQRVSFAFRVSGIRARTQVLVLYTVLNSCK